MLQLGMMRYINTLPFRAALIEGAIQAPFELNLDVPTSINHSLRTGKIDVALISTAEYLQNRDLYTLLPYFSITAHQKVQSVLLYLRGDLRSLDGASIAVTPESASSVLLLRLFCRHFWHVTPEFVPLYSLEKLDDYEALLLCGDTCLRNPQMKGFQVLDMAQIWYYATGLVFPFALFATRTDRLKANARAIEETVHTLQACLKWAASNMDQVEKHAMKACLLPRETIQAYFGCLQYAWGEPEQQGMDRFAALLEEFHVQTVP